MKQNVAVRHNCAPRLLWQISIFQTYISRNTGKMATECLHAAKDNEAAHPCSKQKTTKSLGDFAFSLADVTILRWQSVGKFHHISHWKNDWVVQLDHFYHGTDSVHFIPSVSKLGKTKTIRLLKKSLSAAA